MSDSEMFQSPLLLPVSILFVHSTCVVFLLEGLYFRMSDINIIIIVIIIIIIITVNLFSPTTYQVAVSQYVQISTTDQSDLPQHFTNAVCSAHQCDQ